jgi:hypothetical protein
MIVQYKTSKASKEGSIMFEEEPNVIAGFPYEKHAFILIDVWTTKVNKGKIVKS